MSRVRRQRDSISPSLFPFLAVLLCTMGALVLILMLLVAGAQSSAQQITREAQERFEDEQAKIELASYTFEKQLNEGQIELEKKRLALQHLEEHIQELLDELNELQRTAELLSTEQESTEETVEERAAAISDLEKQLAEASAELENKLEKPDGDKPIFAIIPYDGPNGTHRRPIYLECTATGVSIQPEGILLTPADLKPPYGPGNPLDAALRTIRAEFPPANGAVTSTAYPLLIVRPSGIRYYMMARAAMSGWDDQFGYELVNEDLELAFPDSTPLLEEKITKAIALARDRQAALVMAMPQHYRNGSEVEIDDSLWEQPSGSGSGSGGSGAQGAYSANSLGNPANGTAPGRGGFSATGQAPGSDTTGLTAGTFSSGGFGATGNSSGAAAMNLQGSHTSDSGFNGAAGQGMQGSSAEFSNDPPSLMSPNGSGSPGYGSAFAPASTTGVFGQSTTSESSGSNAGSGPGTAGATGSAGAMGPTGPSAQASGSSNVASATGGMDVSSNNSLASSQGNSSGSGSGGGAGGPQSSGSAQPGGGNGSNSTASPDPNQTAGQPSLNFSSSNTEPTRAVSQSRGDNWAWRNQTNNDTAVVRALKLQCYSDRWVLLADTNNGKNVTIGFDGTPVERAEKLANAVRERIDSWGVALLGGYWQPVLVVDVAPDAEWRFNQLLRLMENSGLTVKRRAAANQ